VIHVAGAEPEVRNRQPAKPRERLQLITLTIWPYTCAPLGGSVTRRSTTVRLSPWKGIGVECDWRS